MSRTAVFLSGPIGAGKTTLGRALADRLGWGFVDGDDHRLPGRSWAASILTTSRGIVAASLATLDGHDGVVIAYPLQCTTWIYHRRRFADAGVALFVASLRAELGAILAPARGRAFSDEERHRTAAMIAEGYGDRPFSDVIIDTGQEPFDAALDRLEDAVRRRCA